MDWSKLTKILETPTITSDMILNKAFCPCSHKISPVFKDPSHYPFYYHLGKVINPKIILQIGSEYGLIGRSFLSGCESVETYLVYCNGDVSFIEKNIKNSKFTNMKDLPDIDLCLIINREMSKDFLQEFLLVWEYISVDGLLIVDYIFTSKQYEDVFLQACKFVNRKPIFFNTRYGAGLIQK